MNNVKRLSYVAVITSDGSSNALKFVTKTEGRNAFWEAGKPAKAFSETTAKDISFGLYCNGFAAVIVKAIDGQILENPA